MSRPTVDEYFATMVSTVATRATCVRRKTGCILVSDKNIVLSTGYNGVPRGVVHCTDIPCGGHNEKSGEGLNKCIAVHAEANAMIQCAQTEDVYTAYCTTEPCTQCARMLLNTACQRVVFLEAYPHSDDSLKLWEQAGKDVADWVHFKNW